VLYSQPGFPAFPVRLASEMFQRAAAHLPAPAEGLTLYDPTCGGAYHLTALGFLFGERIRAIIASDADENALALARRNLSLLTEEGLARREAEIRQMVAEFGKQSHVDALRSLEALRAIRRNYPTINTQVFQANALDPVALAAGLNEAKVDLVISDVPYGNLSGWQEDENAASSPPIVQMLDALRGNLWQQSLVAIAADKKQKITHPAYRRVEKFQVGKRQVAILQPV
jgi:tRNA G10  N-methylase Trm11